jgi:hypothetical protein
VLGYELVNDASGEQLAIFDLAWPNGIQEGLSRPVAVLLNEGVETLALANHAGYLYFITAREFKEYVQWGILAGNGAENSPSGVALSVQAELPASFAERRI